MTGKQWLVYGRKALMNEYAWKNPHSVFNIINFLSKRKKRLFILACCRLVWNKLSNNSQILVEKLEGFVDNKIAPKEIMALKTIKLLSGRGAEADWCIYNIATRLVKKEGLQNICCEVINYLELHVVNPDKRPDYKIYESIVRNLVNPFFKSIFQISNEARKLADVIYEDYDWQSMTVLADMLEDEGCEENILLNHLRSSGPHYKGWWSLDVIRGF